MKIYDVVGLGSCGIDLRVKVPKLPKPVHKVTAIEYEVSEGGVTANNLIQCSKLGLKTAWLGALGKDVWAGYLLKKFKEAGIEVPSILKFSKTATQQFWILYDLKGRYNMVGIPEATRKLTPEIVKIKFGKFIESAKHFHTEVAIVQLKAVLEGMSIAKRSGAKTLLDIDGDPFYLIKEEKIGTESELFKILQLTDIVKFSETGAKGFLKSDSLTVKNIKKILEYGPKMAVVTQGESGCILANQQETKIVKSVKIGKAIDEVGAGDAFMGGLSYGLLQNWSLQQTGEFANACGAFKCMHFGTRASGELGEINKFLSKK